MFLDQFGDRFRRAAAARKNHHARRGGLVEHVAQMMRSATAICGVYANLNRDLLITGVLFHDCGKLWENNYPEAGFAQNVSIHGEMLGHIPLGIELVNKLWRDLLDSDAARDWLALEPASEDVRLHLLHLIASHHGELAFGSPTLPRTPEAFALHYIDNLDAKSEMVRMAYEARQRGRPRHLRPPVPAPRPPRRTPRALRGRRPAPPPPRRRHPPLSPGARPRPAPQRRAPPATETTSATAAVRLLRSTHNGITDPMMPAQFTTPAAGMPRPSSPVPSDITASSPVPRTWPVTAQKNTSAARPRRTRIRVKLKYSRPAR